MMADSKTVDFSGVVVRFEPDGFGIIRFDRPVGPSANTFGLTSSSTATIVVGDPINFSLTEGMKVKGTAEADEKDVAKIKTVEIDTD